MKGNRNNRAGIIGLGRIGFSLQFDKKREQPATHSAALYANKKCFLAGGYDRDLQKMADWSRKYPKAKIYDNMHEMLSDGKWDIIVIAVGEEEHLPVIETAVKAKPRLIILEKPVAPSLKEALRIKKLCDAGGVPVCVNHERRYSKDYRLVAGLLSSGALGRTVSARGSIYSPNFAWYRGDLASGKGTLVHDGTHLVDALRFLTGENIRVTGAEVSGKDNKGNVSGISVSGFAGTDISLRMEFGFRTRQFEFEIDLVCESGRVRIGNGILDVYRARKSPFYEGFQSLWRDPAYGVKRTGKTGYFSGMVENCVRFLEGKEALLSTLDDGIETMRTVEAAARSAGCK